MNVATGNQDPAAYPCPLLVDEGASTFRVSMLWYVLHSRERYCLLSTEFAGLHRASALQIRPGERPLRRAARVARGVALELLLRRVVRGPAGTLWEDMDYPG